MRHSKSRTVASQALAMLLTLPRPRAGLAEVSRLAAAAPRPRPRPRPAGVFFSAPPPFLIAAPARRCRSTGSALGGKRLLFLLIIPLVGVLHVCIAVFILRAISLARLRTTSLRSTPRRPTLQTCQATQLT